MKDLAGSICDCKGAEGDAVQHYTVYEIVESVANPQQFEVDGYVNCLFSSVPPMLRMLESMELIFVRAGFILDSNGRPCVGHTFELEEAVVLLDQGITLELVYQDEYETPFYFKVRRREVW